MAKLLKLRRGTTTQHASFTGAEGEVTVDITKDTAVVHDGSQAGGRPLAREDMSNVSSASIAGRLGTGAIQGTQLENSGVTAGAYGSSSAIPIVTVDAQGLVTAASTTAIDSTTIANGTSNVAVANNGDITTTRSGTARLVVDNDGVDVTGTLTSTGSATSADLTLSGSNPKITFTDSNDNPDYVISGNAGDLTFYDSTNAVNRLVIQQDGHVDVTGNLDVGAGIDVTGDITCNGTVDGVDIATKNTLFDGLTASSGVLKNGVTGTTQAQSDNTTKISTTAYVRTAISEAQAFPSGTKMLFQQTSAPTGWTKVTSSVDNKALRVVSGTVGSGGTNAFSNTLASRGITANSGNTTAGGNISVANATQGGNVSVANTTAGGNLSISSVSTSGNVNSHTLSTNEMPSHAHRTYMGPKNSSNNGQGDTPGANLVYINNGGSRVGPYYSAQIQSFPLSEGGGGGHSHGFSGSSHSHNGTLSGTAHNHNATFSGSAHNHNATFSGSAHNHSITVTNLDMAVQYLDVIIASKD